MSPQTYQSLQETFSIVSLCILAHFSQQVFIPAVLQLSVILAAAGEAPGSDLAPGKRLGQWGDWSCSEPPWHSCPSRAWVSFSPAGLEAVVCGGFCPKMLCWAPAIREQLRCLQGGWQEGAAWTAKPSFLLSWSWTLPGEQKLIRKTVSLLWCNSCCSGHFNFSIGFTDNSVNFRLHWASVFC